MRVRAAAVALLVGLAAAGCASGRSSGATDSSTLIQVAAAQSVWGDIAAQLGGIQVRVTSITAGTSAEQRDFEPSAADIKTISGAQLFILDGAGFDPWADQAASAHPGVGRVELDAGNQVGVDPGGNPYIWDDPAYLESVADQITADYIQLRPGSTAYFQSQQQAFDSGTLAADEALIGRIKSAYSGTAVGGCDPVAVPLAAQLGLKLLTCAGYGHSAPGPVAEGVATAPAPGRQPAGAQVHAAQIKVYLYDTQDTGAAARAALADAEAAHIPVVPVSEAPAGADEPFQQWQAAQLEGIEHALATAAGR
jgi:zinc/manganese transport system substrate-binding protein